MESDMRRWRSERRPLLVAAVAVLLWHTAVPAQWQWQVAALVLIVAWGLLPIMLGGAALREHVASAVIDAPLSEAHRLLAMDVIALNDAVATEIMGWHLSDSSGRRLWCGSTGKPVEMVVHGKACTICRVPFVARVNNPSDWAFQPATDFHAVGIDWRVVVIARLRELGVDDDFSSARSGHEFCRAAVQAVRLRGGSR